MGPCGFFLGLLRFQFQVQDAYAPWVIPFIVFLTLVVFGSLFLVKLMLAVIWDKFQDVQAQIDVSKEAEEMMKQQAADTVWDFERAKMCPPPCWPA